MLSSFTPVPSGIWRMRTTSPVPHAEDKVVLPVREQGLDHVRGDGLPLAQGAHHEDAATYIRRDPQLLGPHVDVAQHDIVRDHVLHEGAAVMLLLVIGLGGVQRHGGHGADRPADLIVPQSEGRVIELGAPAGERLEGLPLQAEQCAGGIVDGRFTYSAQRWPIRVSSLQATTTPSPSITPMVRSVFSFICRTTP